MYKSLPPISSTLLSTVVLKEKAAEALQILQIAFKNFTFSALGINSSTSLKGCLRNVPERRDIITILPCCAIFSAISTICSRMLRSRRVWATYIFVELTLVNPNAVILHPHVVELTDSVHCDRVFFSPFKVAE